METSKRITYLVSTTFVILNVVAVVAAASPGVNPMMMSRNALSQSVKRVSFGNRKSSSVRGFSPVGVVEQNEYDDRWKRHKT